IKGLDPSEAGTKVCPGLPGGHNWQSTAFDPRTGLYYFGSTDGCQTYQRRDQEFVEGRWYQLSGTQNLPGDPAKGSLIAMDTATGKIRWRFEMVRNPAGGTLATAGNLVFTGDGFGNLIALDSRNGKVLWRFQTGASVTSSPITYTFEGKQYIAIAAGN